MTKTSIMENLPSFSTSLRDFPGHLASVSLRDASQRMRIFRMGNTTEKAKMSEAIPLEPALHMCWMPSMME